MNFCILNKETKTYNYMKKYLTFIKDNRGCIISFDNKIQKEELNNHLRINNIKDDRKNIEVENWIYNHAENFRTFLNSIKILALMVESDDCSFDKFCILVDKYNSIKMSLIDSIY